MPTTAAMPATTAVPAAAMEPAAAKPRLRRRRNQGCADNACRCESGPCLRILVNQAAHGNRSYSRRITPDDTNAPGAWFSPVRAYQDFVTRNAPQNACAELKI
jgi:hypothetical protein